MKSDVQLKSLKYIHWNWLQSRLSPILRFILFVLLIYHQTHGSEWIERLCYIINPMICYASYRKYSIRETLELNYALTLRLSSFKLDGCTATATFVWLSRLGTSYPSLYCVAVAHAFYNKSWGDLVHALCQVRWFTTLSVNRLNLLFLRYLNIASQGHEII